MPDYDGDRWVALHRYQERDWPDLIAGWQGLNRQLLTAARSAPHDAWKRELTIGRSKPLTLEFVFDDYLSHMIHHLQHMGIDIHDRQLSWRA